MPNAAVFSRVQYAADPACFFHLFVPKKKGARKKPPLLVLIHGGGWTGGTLDQYLPHCFKFAEEGFAAATIEYRFVPRVACPEIIHDAAKACAFLKEKEKEFNLDGSRMGLMGSSAGGHLALTVAARFKEFPKLGVCPSLPIPLGVVAQCPATSLTENTDGRLREAVQNVQANCPLEECSPLHIQAGKFPPVQYQLGDKDDLITVEASLRFLDHLKGGNVSTEFHKIEDGEHGYGYNRMKPAGEKGFKLALEFFKKVFSG